MNEWLTIYLIGVLLAGLAGAYIYRSFGGALIGLAWPPIAVAFACITFYWLVNKAEGNICHPVLWRRWTARAVIAGCLMLCLAALITR